MKHRASADNGETPEPISFDTKMRGPGALSATGGAQAEAARRLGLSRSDVSYKLGKHNIRTATS